MESKKVASAYDKVAQSYDDFYTAPKFSQENLEVRKMLLSIIGEKQHVLDIGSGTGFVPYIIPELKDRYIGIDISASMVAVASSKHEGFGFFNTDIHGVPHKADCIISTFGSISYLEKDELENLKRRCEDADYFFMHYKDGYKSLITGGEVEYPASYDIKCKFAGFKDVRFFLYNNYVIVTNKNYNLPSMDMAQFFDAQDFRVAKTMVDIPHAYIVIPTLPRNQIRSDFERVVRFVRNNGYKQNFGRRVFSYFNHNGFKYWTMGDPVEETIIFNRALI